MKKEITYPVINYKGYLEYYLKKRKDKHLRWPEIYRMRKLKRILNNNKQ